MITILDLRQYRSLKREVNELENEIKNEINSNQVQDTVKESSLSFPYVQCTATVAGFKTTPEIRRLRSKRMSAILKIHAIENFIDNIQDSEIRQIFELYYIIGRFKVSWQYVACKMGGADESCPRQKHNRYLKQIKK